MPAVKNAAINETYILQHISNRPNNIFSLALEDITMHQLSSLQFKKSMFAFSYSRRPLQASLIM